MYTIQTRRIFFTPPRVVALGIALALSTAAHAATIGAGTAIPHDAVDTAGANPRTNVGESFTLTLDPGIYYVDDWEYAAGQTGLVTPFVATSTGTNAYNVEAVGDEVNVTSTGIDSADFGNSNTFIVSSTTTFYAGITNSSGQNPIYLDNGAGTTDHDSSPDPITAIDQSVTGFSNANLPRTYAFALNVETRAVDRVGADIDIPHDALDNPDGGPRMNIDLVSTLSLGPGVYEARDFSFSSGQDGSVIPFLATFDGANYQIIALGDTVTVPDADLNVTVDFGNEHGFTLLSTTTIYAGITNPSGSDNPVYFDNGAGPTDHDGTPVTLTGAGQTFARTGISNQNLGRTYAFSIGVVEVPEPSSMLLVVAGCAGLAARRTKRVNGANGSRRNTTDR